jgi:cytoskeletal protein CcmA (bactofilin family)
MFFKKQQMETTPTASLAKVSSFVTRDSTFKGDIVTNDCVEISGEFIGSIECKKDLIINEFGSVTGDVKASRVITEGKIDGKVLCEEFQGEVKSFTTDYIEAKDVTISGVFEGVIRCEKLNVTDGGVAKNRDKVQSLVQAKDIEVAGKIEGDIACETLSTSKEANIKGKLFVNQLLNNGGTIDGFIGKFQEILEEEIEVEQDSDSSDKISQSSTKSNNPEKIEREKELLTTD